MMTLDNIRHLPRLRIGEAMRLFGMTARALRFYEERGLIEARRDRMNCRYYDAAARKRLEWIRLLRAGGLSIDDIREVLSAEDASAAGHQCALDKLEARHAAAVQELSALEGAIADLRGPGAQTAGQALPA